MFVGTVGFQLEHGEYVESIVESDAGQSTVVKTFPTPLNNYPFQTFTVSVLPE